MVIMIDLIELLLENIEPEALENVGDLFLAIIIVPSELNESAFGTQIPIQFY